MDGSQGRLMLSLARPGVPHGAKTSGTGDDVRGRSVYAPLPSKRARETLPLFVSCPLQHASLAPKSVDDVSFICGRKKEEM
jgi:hypothetical protein